MGNFFPKTHLKWREPKAIRLSREAIERPSTSRRLLYCLIVTCLLMTAWYGAKLNPAKNPPQFHQALVMAIIAGPVFVYGFPWLYRLCPSEVRLTERAIIHSIGNRVRSWHYDKIQNCSIKSDQIEDELLRVLVIESIKGKITALGIDKPISIEEIGSILRLHGVSMVEEAGSTENL